MPLPTPKKGQRMADFLAGFMGNATAVKDYPDTKQRYAVGASIFRTKQKKRKNMEAGEETLLAPNEGESFQDFLNRFVKNPAMTEMFPDAGDRAEVASELYEDMEESSEDIPSEDSEAGSDSEEIVPALEEPMAGDDDVDELEDMTIEGVSVLTTGMAKGHKLQIDQMTLQQVMECANNYKNGVKVNENHGAGIGDIVGKLTNFRIDDSGEKLLADLTFLKSREDRAKYYMDLAQEIPDSFGISISFSGQSEQNGTDLELARCQELYSADLVQHPAANPTGLFSADSVCVSVDKKELSNMTTDTTTPTTEKTEKTYDMGDFEKRMMSFEDRLKKIEDSLTPKEEKTDKAETLAEPPAPTMKEEKKREDETAVAGALEAKEVAKTELSSVLTQIRTELSKIVSAPVAHSAPAVEEKKPQSFSDYVNFEMKQNNISKAEALRLCVGKYNEVYRKELSAGGIKVL